MIRIEEKVADYCTRTLRNKIAARTFRPSYYNRKVANELRLRGYKVSLMYGDVWKKR